MDLLIKLYALPPAPEPPAGAQVRKPIGPEHRLIIDWVAEHFSTGWASEAQVALANRPVTLFIATHHDTLAGFACYDATARGLFGPIGVAAKQRGRGIGESLLRACLDDMASAGYAYAVAGSVGPVDFFRRVAGAVDIPGSDPGLYRGMLRPPTAP